MRKLIASASLAAAASSGAATLQISTASGVVGADTYLRSDGGATATNNYGAGTQMLVGSNNTGGGFNALLRFDLAALQTAAGGQPIVINSVSLTLHTSSTSAGANNGSGMTMGLYDYGFAFVEGTGNGTTGSGNATWNNPNGVNTDLTAGGTAGTQLKTLTGFSFGTNQTIVFSSSAAMVSDLQSAYDTSTNPNYLIKETTSLTDQTFLRFDTKDTVGGVTPYLTIDYTVVPEPTAAVLGSFGVLGLLRRRRQR